MYRSSSARDMTSLPHCSLYHSRCNWNYDATNWGTSSRANLVVVLLWFWVMVWLCFLYNCSYDVVAVLLWLSFRYGYVHVVYCGYGMAVVRYVYYPVIVVLMIWLWLWYGCDYGMVEFVLCLYICFRLCLWNGCASVMIMFSLWLWYGCNSSRVFKMIAVRYMVVALWQRKYVMVVMMV